MQTKNCVKLLNQFLEYEKKAVYLSLRFSHFLFLQKFHLQRWGTAGKSLLKIVLAKDLYCLLQCKI